MNRLPFSVLVLLAFVAVISVFILVLSIVGAITGMIWRFIFSPLGVICIVLLVVYFLFGRKKRR